MNQILEKQNLSEIDVLKIDWIDRVYARVCLFASLEKPTGGIRRSEGNIVVSLMWIDPEPSGCFIELERKERKKIVCVCR